MASPPKPPSGTDIVSLGISVDSTQPEAASAALDKLGASTVKVAVSLDDLTKGYEHNNLQMNESTKSNIAKVRALEEQWRAEQQVIISEKMLSDIHEQGAWAAMNLIVKLDQLIKTYGMTKEEVFRLTAAELNMAEAAEPLIAKLEALKLASEQLAIQHKRDTELNVVRQKQFEEESAAVQKQILVQQQRDSEMNTLRQKEVVDYVTHWEKMLAAEDVAIATQIATQQKRDIELNSMRQKQILEQTSAVDKEIDIQKKRDTELNAIRQKETLSYISFWEKELVAQEISAAKQVALAEKQAIEEMKWNALSVKTRIEKLQELKLYQANFAISKEAIGDMFSSAAIADLPKFIANQKAYTKTLEESAAAHALLTKASNETSISYSGARAKTETLVLIHEILQGNFKRIPGSLMVLMEYTNAASIAMTGMGAVVLGLIAGLGTMIYSIVKAIAVQKDMDDALVMTGHYAGVTTDKLNEMARAAAGTSGSIGEAKKAVTELTASGKFTGDQIAMITDSVVALEHATGTSIEKTIKEFESLAVQATGHTSRTTTAISDAILKLDQHYHFLNESIYENILASQKEGNQREAAAIAIKAFHDATKKMAEEAVDKIGNIEGAWKAVKHAIGSAVDAMGNWGKSVDPALKIEQMKALLAETTGKDNHFVIQDNPSTGRGGAQLGMERSNLIAALAKAQEELNAADKIAIDQGKARQVQSDANNALQQVSIMRTTLQKKSTDELTEALAKYKEQAKLIIAANPEAGKEGGYLSAEKQVADIAAITKAHTAVVAKGNDDRIQLLRDNLLIQNTALDQEKSIYDQRIKNLTTYHKMSKDDNKKYSLEENDYYAGREVSRKEYIKSEEIIFTKEAELINSFHGKNPRELAENKVRYDTLLRQHSEFLNKMQEARAEDEAAQEAETKKKFDKIADAISKEGNKELERLDKTIAKQKEHNAEIGKTKEQIELARQAQEDAGTATLQIEADAINALLNESELQGVLQGQYIEIYSERLAYLDRIIAKRKEESQLLVKGAQLEAQAVLDKEWNKTNKKISDDLTNAIVDGGGNGLKKLLKDMEKGFAKLILQPIISPISSGISSLLNPNAAQSANGLLGTFGNSGSSLINNVSNIGSSIGNIFGASAAGWGVGAGGLGLTTGGTSLAALGLAGGGTSAATIAGGVAGGGLAGGLSTALAAIPGWGWAALGAAAIASFFGDDGPEKNTSFKFKSNNELGNIDINKRGNEGRTGQAYANYGNGTDQMGISSTFGTFGVQQTFWGNQEQIPSLLKAVKVSDDALAVLMSKEEQDRVKAFVTTKELTVGTGAEGANTSEALSIVFADRIKNIFEGIGGELTGLLDGFKGDSQALVVESQALLTARSQMAAYSQIFGESVNLQKLAALKTGSESVAQAISRLRAEFILTDDISRLLGKDISTAFGTVGLASTAAREKLIALAGGIDSLRSMTQFYADNFFTDAQKIAPTVKAVTDQMTALGFAGIKTKDGFKEVVNGLDLSSISGEETYIALMKLAPAFAQVSDYFDKATKDAISTAQATAKAAEDVKKAAKDSAVSLVDIAFSGLQKAIDSQKNALQKIYDSQLKALQDQSAIASTSLQNIQSVFNTLSGALKTVQPLSKDAANGILNAALAHSNAGGSLANFAGLSDALQAVAKPSEALFTTFLDFQKDQQLTANTISALKDNAGSQVSVAQMTLNAIQDTINTLNQNHADDLAHLDSTLALAQLQVDAIHGVDNSVVSVTLAIQALSNAIVGAKSAGAAATVSPAITDAAAIAGGFSGASNAVSNYAEKYTGEAYYLIPGVNDYQSKISNAQAGAAATGMSVDQWIQLGTGHSEAYWKDIQNQFDLGLHPTTTSATLDGSHASGLDNVPFDGYRAELHKGERVLTANENRSNLELIAEVKELRRTMEAHLFQVMKNTQKSAELLEDSAYNTRPLNVTVV